MTELVSVCPTCGEVHEQIGALQATIAKLSREKASLQGELTRQGNAQVPNEQVASIFEFWVVALDKDRKRTKLRAKRAKVIRDRLRDGHPADQLERAILGLKGRPFVTEHGRKPRGSMEQYNDELEVVLRDETTVERFERYYEQDEAARRAGASESEQRGVEALIQTNGRNYDDPDTPRAYPDALRRVLTALGDRDLEVDGTGAKYMAQCPSHDDRSPSLSIIERPDGAVLFNCFAGCDMLQIARDLGLDRRGLWGSSYGRAA